MTLQFKPIDPLKDALFIKKMAEHLSTYEAFLETLNYFDYLLGDGLCLTTTYKVLLSKGSSEAVAHLFTYRDHYLITETANWEGYLFQPVGYFGEPMHKDLGTSLRIQLLTHVIKTLKDYE